MPDLFLVSAATRNFNIPKTYSDLALSIEVVPLSYARDWYRIGFLSILLPRGGDWVRMRSIELTWQQIVELPYQQYRLSFTARNWLPASNLIIEPYQVEYNPMSINYQDVDRQTGPVANALVPGAVGAFGVAGADPNRHNGTIYNQTNRVVYIAWGTVSATTADLAVPAGANLVIPEDYTGAIQGLSTAGVTGNVRVQTTSYL